MSVQGLGIKTTVNGLSVKIKNIVSLPNPDVSEENTPKSSIDSVKTTIRIGTKVIPANIFKSNTEVKKSDISTTKKVDINLFVYNPEDKIKFDKLFSKIEGDFSDRYSGKEAKNALEIISNPKLFKIATDLQKISLIRVVTYQLDESNKNTPASKKLLEGINTIVDDFKNRGKLNKLTEYLTVGLSNTGFFMAGMDDWGAEKIASNEKILTSATPSQKTELLYSLKLGYTKKSEEKAIVNIIKNSVDNGQFKSLMGYWSDGLDRTSATIDALYSDLGGKNKTEFLGQVERGMKNESISNNIMKELYGGVQVIEDISKSNNAKKLENEGNYLQAAKNYSDIGDFNKSQEMYERAGNKDMKEGNYLSLVKNFISHTNIGFKSTYESGEEVISKVNGSHLTRTSTSYLSDKMDNALKNHPILQSKNVFVIKEEREKNLQKLNILKVKPLTIEQKSQDKQNFELKMDEMTGTKAHTDNKTKLLLDGEVAFNRLKERIENSKESIFIEVFLFHDDKKGNEIADLLIKKANQGLDVRLVVDGTMNSSEIKIMNKLKNSKVKFLKNKGGYNNIIENRGLSAYHRKLYIFDKKSAMTGGINVGDEYLTKGRWHDLLVEVQGPIMSDTLNDFYKHWNFSSGESKDKIEKAPPPSSFKNMTDSLPFDTSGTKLRLLTTDPNNKEKDIKIWMIESIKNAKERVLIQDPYFNDPEIVKHLKDAVSRGVKVEVIFPNSNDVAIMKHLDDSVMDELYAAGAGVFLYNTSGKESFNHLKATIVDDYVSIGSSNKDVRALNTNQEINYVVDDKNFADMFIKQVWEKDKSNSQPAEPQPENFAKRLVKEGFKQIPSMF